MKKVYEIEYIVNFDSDFFRGFLIITNYRLILASHVDGKYITIIDEKISDIHCIFVHREYLSQGLIQVSTDEYTKEIILYQDFTSRACIEFINMCYLDLIKTYKKPSVYKYSINDFIKIKILGEGSNGKVYLVRNKRDGKLYAAKILNKLKIIEDGSYRYLRSELFILEHIKNEFVLKLFCYFQTDNFLYLVTEYIGLDLYCLLNKMQNKILNEEQVAFYTICVAQAIQCLHSHDFTFRDLKPENILIDDEGYPVLCDFGLVNLLFPTHKAYTMCGTPEYFAPELINSTSYDHKVDWWGMGILIYELIYGFPPFISENTHQLYDLILNSDIEFPNEIEVSDIAKDLIKKLLNKNPDLRLGAKRGIIEIYEHEFYSDIDIPKILQKRVKPPIEISNEKKINLQGEEIEMINEEEFILYNFSAEDLEIIKSHKVILCYIIIQNEFAFFN